MAANPYESLIPSNPYASLVPKTTTPSSIFSPLSSPFGSVAGSTAPTSAGNTNAPILDNLVGGIVQEAGSLGQTILSPLGNIAPPAYKTYQQRYTEDTAANLQAANQLPSYPGLTVTGMQTKENQAPLAAPRAIGGIVIGATSLYPGFGAEADALKAIVAAKDVVTAARVGRAVGIAEDLIPSFSEAAIKAGTKEEAKALIESFSNLQKTTKTAEIAQTATTQEPRQLTRPPDISPTQSLAQETPARTLSTPQPIAQATQRVSQPVIDTSLHGTIAPEVAKSQAEEMVTTKLPQLIDEYIATHKNFIGTDEAKSLFPSYATDPHVSDAVQASASKVAAQVYDRLLETRKGAGVGDDANTVLFSAGGTGAGKSTALKASGKVTDDYAIVYDGNLATTKSAIAKIDKALANGYDVRVSYTHADVADAYSRALERSRPVTPENHVAMHYGAQDTYQEIAEHYKDNAKVKFRLFDNSGKEPQRIAEPLAFLKKTAYNRTNAEELIKTLKNLVHQRHQQGAISTAKLRAFVGPEGRTISKPIFGGSQAGGQGASSHAVSIFKGFKDLTTKLLEDLKGRSTVSKQYLLDATNRADLKQPERELFRTLLKDEGDVVNVKEFANKVKAELLPLTREGSFEKGITSTSKGERLARYENVNLPSNLRGPVANYSEHVYQSPIKTSAGSAHFGGSETPQNYFAHSRVEDLPQAKDIKELTTPRLSGGSGDLEGVAKDIAGRGDTRRVIEIQSDLFQKGNLERESNVSHRIPDRGTNPKYEKLLDEYHAIEKRDDLPQQEKLGMLSKIKRQTEGILEEFNAPRRAARQEEVTKLDPYRNTWHERVIREEVKQAAKDGKTTLQFPTGETAMNIEGLVNRADKWVTLDNKLVDGTNIKEGDLITYQEHDGQPHPDRRFLITKNSGDGTFDAVDSLTAENDYAFHQLLEKKGLLDDGRVPTLDELEPHLDQELLKYLDSISEHLSAKDTVDTNNPIYKFYEKEVGRYLKNKYGATLVTDPQGVKWWEVKVSKALSKSPTEAFGAVGGIQPDTDENGKVKGYRFDPLSAALGVGAIHGVKRAKSFDPLAYVKEQTAAREAAKSNTGVYAKLGSFVANAKTKLVDFTAPIEDVLNAATKREGIKLKPTEDIHNQIDRVLRAPTIAGQFAKDNGLIDVIRKVNNPDALDQYLIAKHAVELEARGITTGRELEKDHALVEALSPQYESYAKSVSQYSQKLLDYATQTGLVSQETATMLKARYPDYVPFNRVFSEEEKASRFGSGKSVASLSRQTAVQKIVGSTREIESPLESLLAKTNDVVTQGEKNVAGKMLAGYEKLPGNPFQLKELTDGASATHTISYIDKGVKRTFETTPEIANAAKALNVQQLNVLGKIFAFPTRIARLGITGINLPFVAANISKDQVTAFINSSNALRSSAANPVVFTKALFNAVGHGELYQEMVRAGGAGTSFDISRNQAEETIARIRSGRGVVSKVAYTVRHPSELLRALENIIGRSEEFTRLQQYAGEKGALLDQGMGQEDAITGAARAARDNTVNFARRGEWGTVLNSAFLYLNASIQGTRTLLSNLATKPFQTGAKIAVSAMFPVAVATAWNLADPKRKAAYDDIADYEKQNNIIIVPPNPTKDENGKWNVIKIPLSQEINNLVNIPRRGVEMAYGENPLKFGEFASALIGTVSPINPSTGSLLSTVTPQAIKPTIEGAANKNLFTGIPIVPDSMKNLSPANQVKPNTSGSARLLSSPFGVSPLQTEAFIKSSLGGVGMQALNLSDHALAAGGVIPNSQIGGQDIPSAVTARFNKAQGGALSQANVAPLQQALTSQADTAAKLKAEATTKLHELQTSATAKEDFNQLIKTNPALAKEILKVKDIEDKNLTYDEKLLNQLQVANGARAKYIVDKINALPDAAAKRSYYQSLIDKGIVSKNVNEQVLKLLQK